MTAALVALGGGIGALLRWHLSARARAHGATPAGATLAVNVLASFALGLLSGWQGRPEWLVALVGAGLCGALSTWSTHAAEVTSAWRRGQRRHALAAAGLSVLACLLAAAFGHALTP